MDIHLFRYFLYIFINYCLSKLLLNSCIILVNPSFHLKYALSFINGKSFMILSISSLFPIISGNTFVFPLSISIFKALVSSFIVHFFVKKVLDNNTALHISPARERHCLLFPQVDLYQKESQKESGCNNHACFF